MAREQRLAETLVYLADTLVKDFDIVDLFYHLVEAVPQLVHANDAGLLLADGQGALQVMAVTSESVRTVELLQTQTENGPCFDAFESGEPVTGSLDEVTTAKRWPAFSDAAREAGFESVTALPMKLREEVIGALNIFRVQPGGLSDDDVLAAKALADMATIAILQDRSAHGSAIMVDQLQHALNSRVIIEQAKGVIAQELGIPVEEAFARLRRYARNNNQILRGAAGHVVSGRLDPHSLPPS